MKDAAGMCLKFNPGAHPLTAISPRWRRFAAIGSVFVAGCAATGPSYVAAPAPPEGRALVYVYRPDALASGARTASIFMDEHHVADIRNNGYSFFYLKPGTYRVRQRWSRPTLGSDERELNIPISVEAGQTYFLRFSTWVSGIGDDRVSYTSHRQFSISYTLHRQLEQVDAAEGKAEIRQRKLEPAKIPSVN